MRPVAETVCCRTCWTWSELGRHVACQRCGTPLTFADGRRVDAVLAARAAGMPAYMTGDAPPPPGYAYADMLPPGPDPGAYALPRDGLDWVGLARLITLAYGGLTAVALVVLGLLVKHVQLPVYDPNLGATVYRNVDLGAAFVVVAVVAMALFALFAWLTQFTAARVVFLLLDGLAILGALSRLSAQGDAGYFPAVSLISVAVDVGYGFVLLMSLVRPRPRPY
jgi:hypothetical protein